MAQSPGAKGRKRAPRPDAARATVTGSNGKGASRLWGTRFASRMAPIVAEYTSSIQADSRLVPYDIEASIAHARMLGRQGIIPRKDAEAIARGLGDIAREWESGRFELRPELEDVHTNVETRLAEIIGPAAGRLHTARSRNDQVATDFRLYVMDACVDAIGGLLGLQAALVELAVANVDAIMPGYTHVQRAQPVLFAHHLLAYVEMFDRDALRFAAAHGMMDSLPLGAGALAGVPYPIDRMGVAEELALSNITANSMDAVSDRDFVADYIYAAALTMAHVSRLAEDIVLWSSAEYAFVRLPDAFATGSSIMPQKKNADVAELARGRAGRAIGALTNILVTMKGLPLTYNRDMQEDKPILYDAHDTLMPTLAVLAEMLPGITVDAERTKAAAAANYSLATDVADYLTRKGMPFREAHGIVGSLVQQAEKRGVELHELSLDHYRALSPLFEADVLQIDVVTSVRARDVPGGTAPRRVKAELRRHARRIRSYLDSIEDSEPAPAKVNSRRTTSRTKKK